MRCKNWDEGTCGEEECWADGEEQIFDTMMMMMMLINFSDLAAA